MFLQGCLFCCEARHFCAQLRRGNVRSVEALCAPPESVIFCSPDWLNLAAQMDPVALLSKTFVDRCMGQAMGALVKKRPISGKLAVRDDATLTKFCDSFRWGIAKVFVKRCERVLFLYSVKFIPSLLLSLLPFPHSLPPQYRLLWYAQAAVKREALAVWGEVGKNTEEQDVLRSLKEAFEVSK